MKLTREPQIKYCCGACGDAMHTFMHERKILTVTRNEHSEDIEVDHYWWECSKCKQGWTNIECPDPLPGVYVEYERRTGIWPGAYPRETMLRETRCQKCNKILITKEGKLIELVEAGDFKLKEDTNNITYAWCNACFERK